MMTMTKWEYAVLSWQEVWKDGKWDHRAFTFFGPDGSSQPVQSDDNQTLPILNQLGKDGWEVYHVETTNHVYSNNIGGSIYPTAEPVAKIFHLKRPAN